MSIASDQPQSAARSSGRSTPNGARPLSDLLRPIEAPCEADWPILVLETPSERAAWASTVYSTLRCQSRRPEHGKAMRNRVFKVLSILAEHGTVTHPMPPVLWRRLFQLAKLCAHEADWASATGPLMGASNAKLELETWDRSNARRTLRELSRWGLIVPFCPKGNGHRNYRPGATGPQGSGWSLAPLLLMIDTLESIAVDELELKKQRIELPRKIQSVIYAIAAIVKPFADEACWAALAVQKLDVLRADRRNASKGSIERLEHVLSNASALLEAVERDAMKYHLGADGGKKMSSRPDTGVHPQYNDSSESSVRNGNQGERSGNRRVGPEPRRKVSLSESYFDDRGANDAFGIERSGFQWQEAPHLFPFHVGMIQLDQGPTAGSAEILGRLIGVSPFTVSAAERRLGREAAVVCLLMTGQLLSEGAIVKTTEAYMRGIVRKAAMGELNIGHSLFGRRESRNPEA